MPKDNVLSRFLSDVKTVVKVARKEQFDEDCKAIEEYRDGYTVLSVNANIINCFVEGLIRSIKKEALHRAHEERHDKD